MKPCCKKTFEETKRAIERALFEVYFSPENKAEEKLNDIDRARGYKLVHTCKHKKVVKAIDKK